MYTTPYQPYAETEQQYPHRTYRKKTNRRVFRPKAINLLFFLAAGYMIFSLLNLGFVSRSSQSTIGELLARKEALQREVGGLEQQVGLLHTDAYVERVAREELGLIRPGEKVVIRALPGQGIPDLEVPVGEEFRD
ncbi:MAG: FtsB family cell division protein [Bacillota bacterium]